jgi:hypothetical protein
VDISFTQALMAVIGVVVLFSIITNSGRMIEWYRNNQQPVISVHAKIIAKRTKVSGSMIDSVGSTSTSYYCTFELTTGQRLEYAISGRNYGLLAEGDEGILNFQGTRYQGFERGRNI